MYFEEEREMKNYDIVIIGGWSGGTCSGNSGQKKRNRKYPDS